MGKPIEEYTDKELEKSIRMHETSLANDRKVENPIPKGLIDAIKMKEDFLQKLYEERARRKGKQ